MVEKTFMDYYAVLNVKPGARPGEIKRAYRELALLCHPDRAGEAGAEAFMLIRKAYETLSSQELRRVYDMETRARRNADAGSPARHDMRFVSARIRKRKWWEDPLKSSRVDALLPGGKCALCAGAGVIGAGSGPPGLCWMCEGSGKRER
jgi:curved DNA-binding protein CbpA